MSAELFSPSDVPFNLSGEKIDNSVTPEGEARVRALAESEARKAQGALNFDNRDPVTLASDRIVAHAPQPNGSRLGYMADGGPMSNDEWDEYCALIKTRAIRLPTPKRDFEARFNCPDCGWHFSQCDCKA